MNNILLDIENFMNKNFIIKNKYLKNYFDSHIVIYCIENGNNIIFDIDYAFKMIKVYFYSGVIDEYTNIHSISFKHIKNSKSIFFICGPDEFLKDTLSHKLIKENLND